MKNHRTNDMLADYRAGHTLDTIGKAYGITRERVRQLLAEMPEYHEAKMAKRRVLKVMAQCPNCQSDIIGFSRGPVRKYCSSKCWTDHAKLKTEERFNALKHKRCTRCKQTKAVSKFYILSGTRCYYPHCKTCHNLTSKHWQKIHPRRARIIQRRAMVKYLAKMKSTAKGRAVLLARARAQYRKQKNNPDYIAAQRKRTRKHYLKVRTSTKPYRPLRKATQ